MTQQKLLTEKQASQYIGMSRSFLRQSRMTGQRENHALAPNWVKIGSRSIRYSIDDLNIWIDSFPKGTPRKGVSA